MKVCNLIYKRKYKQETTYYIQETKTATENFFIKLIRETSSGKRQIRTSANVSRTNNKKLEQIDRFHSRKTYHPEPLFRFNCY